MQDKVLTKRPGRARAYVRRVEDPEARGPLQVVAVTIAGDPGAAWIVEASPWPLPNVWVGTVSPSDHSLNGCISSRPSPRSENSLPLCRTPPARAYAYPCSSLWSATRIVSPSDHSPRRRSAADRSRSCSGSRSPQAGASAASVTVISLSPASRLVVLVVPAVLPTASAIVAEAPRSFGVAVTVVLSTSLPTAAASEPSPASRCGANPPPLFYKQTRPYVDCVSSLGPRQRDTDRWFAKRDEGQETREGLVRHPLAVVGTRPIELTHL